MTGNRVAVLMGGWTSEARVSRVTASFCGQAARNAGWDAVEIEVDRNIAATLAEMKPARVFNALHGQKFVSKRRSLQHGVGGACSEQLWFFCRL